MTWIPRIPVATYTNSNDSMQDDLSPMTMDQNELTPFEELDNVGHNVYNLAYDAPVDGVLDPVVV